MLTRESLSQVRRIVVKVGSSTLTHRTGQLNYGRIERLVRELADLANQGKELILVTSGAVSAGMGRLQLTEKPKTIPEKQAAAAVGQGILMHTYEKLFAEYGQVVAQVLLTREDSVDRRRYLNSRHTLQTLLAKRVIPIVNENDVVAIDELKIGDNDTLSALVAGIVDAALLVLLSDVAGLYDKNPQEHSDARLIPVVTDITPEISALAGGPGTARGTGGMYTKLQAAKIAIKSGVAMIIANGAQDGVLQDIIAGKDVGTLFVPQENPLHVRKRWIAFGSRIRGTIAVDAGCARAIVEHGSSLLPSGIVRVENDFAPGSIVRVLSVDGREIARGITNYSAADVRRIMGAHSQDIADILGGKTYDEVIHRDNLVALV